MGNLVFLSHIHAEAKVAAVLKEAISDEFSGFVDVFVSSTSSDNPAGSQFLKTIEEKLATCVAAVYLVSAESIKRPWINFELGAVWIRSYMDQARSIPVIPMCYAGMSKDALPIPLNSLNSINLTKEEDLKVLFEALQLACGGEGRIKTNLKELSETLKSLEYKMMVGDHIIEFFRLIDPVKEKFEPILATLEQTPFPPGQFLEIPEGPFWDEDVRKIEALLEAGLKSAVRMKRNGGGMAGGPTGIPTNFANVSFEIDLQTIKDSADGIRKNLR